MPVSASSPTPMAVFFLFLFSVFSGCALAKVPAADTFQYVNQGEFGPFITEYDASYRGTPLFGSPFQLMWYNTTPGEFYLGLRMGLTRSESLFRWVWDANRGKPVGENATLTFGADGNLVLAEADGRVVWSTGTANKGVVGIKIIEGTGNIVLFDKNGRFVWQSFDFPTDTLLPGQSLRLNGPTKLVSRKSERENADGKYSFVVEPKGMALYIADSPKPLPYFNYLGAPFGRLAFSTPTNVTFLAQPETEENFAWELVLARNDGRDILARPNYNASLSILRLQVDGNLVGFTYYEPVDIQAWERTFTFFSERGILEECELPSKCGSLGVCKNDMCVACPTAKGLLGWSESCSPPKLASCKAASYYKVVGVENFLTKFVKGQKLKLDDCKKKCSADCKCLGFFFWENESKCWLAPTLGALNQVSNSSHVAYIKSP